MHSTVRERAGIGFTGDSYAESFVLADVRMSWPQRTDEVMLFVSPEGFVMVAPLPGGRHRIVATVDDAPEHPDMIDVQSLLDARGPVTGAARVHEIVWSSRFRVHHRLADRYPADPARRRRGTRPQPGRRARHEHRYPGRGRAGSYTDRGAWRTGSRKPARRIRAYAPPDCGPRRGPHRPDDADGDAAQPP